MFLSKKKCLPCSPGKNHLPDWIALARSRSKKLPQSIKSKESKLELHFLKLRLFQPYKQLPPAEHQNIILRFEKMEKVRLGTQPVEAEMHSVPPNSSKVLSAETKPSVFLFFFLFLLLCSLLGTRENRLLK